MDTSDCEFCGAESNGGCVANCRLSRLSYQAATFSERSTSATKSILFELGATRRSLGRLLAALEEEHGTLLGPKTSAACAEAHKLLGNGR